MFTFTLRSSRIQSADGMKALMFPFSVTTRLIKPRLCNCVSVHNEPAGKHTHVWPPGLPVTDGDVLRVREAEGGWHHVNVFMCKCARVPVCVRHPCTYVLARGSWSLRPREGRHFFQSEVISDGLGSGAECCHRRSREERGRRVCVCLREKKHLCPYLICVCICIQSSTPYATMCIYPADNHVLNKYVCVCLCQPLTTMPECSQTPRRQRPDYLADFSSGSSADNSCSSSDEEEGERRKRDAVGGGGGSGGGGGRSGEKREKKVSYDLGDKDKNLAERSGKDVWKCPIRSFGVRLGPFFLFLSCCYSLYRAVIFYFFSGESFLLIDTHTVFKMSAGFFQWRDLEKHLSQNTF